MALAVASLLVCWSNGWRNSASTPPRRSLIRSTFPMPEIDINAYVNMPPVDLETRRRVIVAKAQGQHDNLTIDELHELAAITGVLRRRASGPPKATRAKTAKP